MAILRRKLCCHYCNGHLRDVTNVSLIPKTILCPSCEALNHFDEDGNIMDPPAHIVAPNVSFRYNPSRSPSPIMPPTVSEQLFCDSCKHNQTFLANLLGEYLPDEDDPTYAKYEASYDSYKAELEERYPQVCKDCLPRVQDQIQNAGYAAKADQLRRMMEKSEARRKIAQTSRQAWLWKIILLGKWLYLASVLSGILWHAFGLLMGADTGISAPETFNWRFCLGQATVYRSVDQSCLLSSQVSTFVNWACAADLLSIWWNPKLREKTNSLTGRMRGLKTLWILRILVLALRVASLHYWKRVELDYDSIQTFRNTQAVMLGVMALSLISTWKVVRIDYIAPSLLRRPAPEVLPSTPKSAEKTPYRPAHPQPNTFDDMAQAFTSSFQDQDSAALPPSPTLTASSYTTFTTDATTPFAERRSMFDDNDMDWTPTRRRFAQQEAEVIPNRWAQQTAQRASPEPERAREPHSIFSKADPNPFRHKVPAAPVAPAQKASNPWKPGVWAPPLKETVPNFFKDSQKAEGGVGEAKGLEGFGVPKNVKRDAEMFASPKLKYEYYGTMKDTGLEDTFNEMFSK